MLAKPKHLIIWNRGSSLVPPTIGGNMEHSIFMVPASLKDLWKKGPLEMKSLLFPSLYRGHR
jgi:hypothetical protein